VINRIFIEKDILSHPRTQNILSNFQKLPQKTIERYDDIWGKVKKPYLQKRDNLNLFIAQKRGTLIKEAPPAYGTVGVPHYYFIHAYNCIYECEYCYLQGHFHSPDIVLFVNYEEIGKEITHLSKKANGPIWFHAGEFSDSLALSHMTQEIPFYFELFSKIPHAFLELRTKSVNIKGLLKQSPLKNIITTFSLAPEARIKTTDLKTPSLKHRLKAIEKLANHAHPIGLHLDPIIYSENFIEHYGELLDQIVAHLNPVSIKYLSLGVVRFTSQVFHQVQKNYPSSDLLKSEFIKSFDNKIRYPRPMRLWMLSKVKEMAIERGVPEESIYLCME
jgi:spore photoproduct lyase